MASDHYTPVKPAANAQGQTADADDVNSVSNAVETAFETLEAEVDQITVDVDAEIAKAAEWAEQDEDVNITGEPAGTYSAKHHALKAAASASDAADSASAALTSENNASASAANASASETAAAQAAQSLITSFTPNSQAGNYTLVLTDKDAKIIRMTGSSSYALTVPPDVFTTNVMIPVIQTGTGTITITAGSGVTLNTPSGKSLVMYGQGFGVTLYCVDPDTNTWDVVGQLLDA